MGEISMNIIHTDAYRTAFVEYLRRGTPIGLSLKQAADRERYVWRTQRDERVRQSHWVNDGRIFSWSNPPDTGHPGEDYNCRCEAVPYIEGRTEFAFHDFSTSLASSYDRWTDADFVHHYYFGSGRPVTLLEIGHLREIAEQYAYGTFPDGVFRRLADQIADEARETGPGQLVYPFEGSYDFVGVQFSHGDGSVFGTFSGIVEDRGSMLAIAGESRFDFVDKFADPVDFGIEPGGTPYPITGEWSAYFSGEVNKNRDQSVYLWNGNP